jgi:hypothetical protein
MKSEQEIAEECIATYEQRKSARSSWDTQWQQIADYFCPRKANITSTQHQPDSSKEAQIYDGSGYYALDVAVKGQCSDILPVDQPWFAFEPPKPLKGSYAAEQWCQRATRTTQEFLHASNFYPQAAEFIADRTCFGTACFYGQENENGDDAMEQPVIFRQMRIGSYTIGENFNGKIDRLDFEREFNASQLVAEFGEKAVSEKVLQAYQGGKGKQDTKFTVLHCLYPRREVERIAGKMDGPNKPWASVWIEKDSKKVLRVSGYDEQPFSVSRWSTWEGNCDTAPYGYSPAFMALPDMRQLNVLQKSLDVLAEKKANPPMLIPTGFKGDIDYRAGGITWFDPNTTEAARPQAWGLEGDYALGDKRADQKRQHIEAFFQVNMWLAISRMERANITAEEVRARVGEQIRQFSPTYTLLVTEWLQPQLMRFFRVLMRRGFIEQPPEEMVMRDESGQAFIAAPQVSFTSRIALALKELDNMAMSRVLGTIGSVASFSPETAMGMLDNFDTDKLIRLAANNGGLPPEIVRDPDDVTADRMARAQAQQQAQQAALAEQMSKVAANVGKVPADSPVGQAIQKQAAA